MIEINYDDIVTPELVEGAIINNDFEGFAEDYKVLHCLLRKCNPKSVFEVGTNCGVGTNIICHAVPDAKVYSLDLPIELAHISLQSPISEGKGDRVGEACTLPYTQLRADSMTFDFNAYPCEAYYCDGDHTEVNVRTETFHILKQNPGLIVYHDSDMPEVMQGILNGQASSLYGGLYQLYRVVGTRIAFLWKYKNRVTAISESKVDIDLDKIIAE